MILESREVVGAAWIPSVACLRGWGASPFLRYARWASAFGVRHACAAPRGAYAAGGTAVTQKSYSAPIAVYVVPLRACNSSVPVCVAQIRRTQPLLTSSVFRLLVC